MPRNWTLWPESCSLWPSRQARQSFRGGAGWSQEDSHPPPATASCISLGTEEQGSGFRPRHPGLNQSLLKPQAHHLWNVGGMGLPLGMVATRAALMGAVTDLPCLSNHAAPSCQVTEPLALHGTAGCVYDFCLVTLMQPFVKQVQTRLRKVNMRDLLGQQALSLVVSGPLPCLPPPSSTPGSKTLL